LQRKTSKWLYIIDYLISTPHNKMQKKWHYLHFLALKNDKKTARKSRSMA